jgi:hypothetical protein
MWAGSMFRRRRTVTVGFLGVAGSLALAGVALAKGPVDATITGPGLATPLKLDFQTPALRPTMTLLTTSGALRQIYGPPLTRPRPQVTLGPRYLVVYRVIGPRGKVPVRQSLYPYATGGAVTYMTKGQHLWNKQRTRGGWSRSSLPLTRALIAAGLPAAPPG